MRVDRDLRRDHLLHARVLLVHDLGRGAWVDAAELEAHHRAGEETRVNVYLGRVVEVGSPNLVAVGRPLRAPLRADQELEPSVAGAEERGRAFELSPEPLPGQAGVSQLQRNRLVPLRAELPVLDGLRVETDLRQHRVDDRLPADVVEGDGLPLQLPRVLDLAPRRKDEVEHLARDHLPDGLHGNARLDRCGEDAGGGVAHVLLAGGDLREVARSVAGTHLDVDIEGLVVAHHGGDEQVVVVHHLERAAWRDPTNGVDRARPRSRASRR